MLRDDGKGLGLHPRGQADDGRTADDGRQHPSCAGCTLGTRGRGERENDVVD